MHESEKWKWSCAVVSDFLRPHGLQPTRLLHPWDFPGNIYIYNWITCLYTWNNIVNQLYFSKKTNKKRIIGKKISLNGGWASAQHKIKLSYLLSITADTHPYWELQVAAFKYAASISPHGDNWFLVGFQKPWQIKWEFNLILQEVSVGLWVDLICSCQSTANLKLCKDARRFRNLRLSQEIIEC